MAFGRYIAELRRSKAMTLVQLGKAINVTHPAVIAIEKGQVAIGDDMAARLFAALEIPEMEREKFMMMAAATRIYKRLVGDVNEAPPTLTHYLVRMLQMVGVPVAKVEGAEVAKDVKAGQMEIHSIQKQFESGLAEYLKALAKNAVSSLPLLKLDLGDGERMICGVLLAKC